MMPAKGRAAKGDPAIMERAVAQPKDGQRRLLRNGEIEEWMGDRWVCVFKPPPPPVPPVRPRKRAPRGRKNVTR